MSSTPKTNAARKSRQVIFRLPENEYLKLEEDAKKLWLKPNELSRKLVEERSQRVITHTFRYLDPVVVLRLNGIGVQLKELLKVVPDETGAINTLIAELTRIVMTEVEARIP